MKKGDVLSNSEVDKLGKRLRDGSDCEKDFKKLEAFKGQFKQSAASIYDDIIECLKNFEAITITPRKTKTRQSIIDKLQREKNLRLSQIQDIEGCRIVVEGTLKPSEEIEKALLEKLETSCKKTKPLKRKHKTGYRAIHIIVKKDKWYEIQLRTLAQDIWANLVEHFSKSDNKLKYGKGEEKTKKILIGLSKKFEEIDKDENLSGAKLKNKIQDVLPYRTQQKNQRYAY